MMRIPEIHPAWREPAAQIVDGYSIEMTAKDIAALDSAASAMPPQTPVSVTFLPSETLDLHIAACQAVRRRGFEPMPHFSARRFETEAEFRVYLAQSIAQAGIRRCFLVAGDPPVSLGPFSESRDLLRTGAFEEAGIEVIGIAGHPEGHPNMSEDQCFDVLLDKCAEIRSRGMAPLIVTQFVFDEMRVLDWLTRLRSEGIDAPVRLGVPGPAGIKTLMRFAARCGVGTSAAVLGKYGISIGHLLDSAGPDNFLAGLSSGLTPELGPVRLHFYPFGGLEKTAEWINRYRHRQ